MTQQLGRSIAGHPRWGLLLGLLLCGCGALVQAADKDDDDDKADREHPIVTPARVVQLNGRSVVRLDASAAQRAGIRTLVVRKSPQLRTLRAFATVVDVQGLAQGVGTWQVARALASGTEARLAASHAEAERAAQLYAQDHNLSLAQWQAAQAAESTDRAAWVAAQAQSASSLAALRLAWGWEVVGGLSRGASAGGWLHDVLDRRNVLVRVSVPPGVTLDHPPSRLQATIEGGANVTLRYVGPASQADARLVGRGLYYLAPATPDGSAGARWVVAWPTSTAVQGSLLPAAAVVWWQGRAWYFEQVNKGDFVRREAPADIADAVIDLADGAQVVVQGAQVLLSEELRAANFSTDVGGR